MKEIKIKVNGMMCNHCVEHVKNGLLALRGVKKVEIGLDEGIATIYAKKDFDDHEFEKVLAGIGYGFGGRI